MLEEECSIRLRRCRVGELWSPEHRQECLCYSVNGDGDG